MKPENINQAYSIARERYAGVGVDTEKVLAQMQGFHLSMHCWQSDDVKGFEVQAGAPGGHSRPRIQYFPPANDKVNNQYTHNEQSLFP